MRNDINVEEFASKLNEEKERLESELSKLGVRNPSNPADWEATEGEGGERDADRNTQADDIEEYEERTAILKDLETRYNNVLAALKRVEEGTYGLDEKTGEPIPVERLEANPAAGTTITSEE